MAGQPSQRDLYIVLVKDLARDPSESLHIIAFWLWITSSTIMQNILSLPLFLINELADEAVKCLRCIDPQTPGPSGAIEIREFSRPRYRFNAERSETQLTQDILSNDISMQYLRGKRPSAFHEVQNLVGTVCIPALSDLFERFRHGEFVDSPVRTLMMSPIPPVYLPQETLTSGWNFAMDRTLFVTFTGGDVVYGPDLGRFLEETFGCEVEMLVFLQECFGERNRILYGRLLLDSPDKMSLIVEGDNRAKYSINGKDVWLHRCVERWD